MANREELRASEPLTNTSTPTQIPVSSRSDESQQPLRGYFVSIDGSAHVSADPTRRARCHAMVRALVRRLLVAGGGVTTLLSADPRADPADPDSAATFIWTVLAEVDAHVAANPPPRRFLARIVLSPKTLAERLPEHHGAMWKRLLAADCLDIKSVDDAAYFGATFRPVQAQHGDALVIVSGGKGVVHLSSLFRSVGKPVIPIDVDVGSSLKDGPGGAAIYREALAYPERFVAVDADHLRRALPRLSLERGDSVPEAVAGDVHDLLLRLRTASQDRSATVVAAAAPSSTLEVIVQSAAPIDWSRFAEHAHSLLSGAVLEPGATPTSARFRVPGFDRHDVIRAAEAGVFDDFARGAGGQAVQEITADDECLYELLPPTHFETPTQTDVAESVVKAALRGVKVLVVTATEVERSALLSRLAPPRGAEGILRGSVGELTVRVGRLGGYDVAHVECAMGSLDRRGSALTTSNAITRLRPRAVVTVGIAFGVDRRKQRFGDVLLADSIAPYELAKVTSDATVRRAANLRAGATLVERFATRHDDWRLERGVGVARAHTGLVLSGEKVVDAQEFRNVLRAEYPTALGGEMEGTGVYAAASRQNVEVLLAKAVCDFADGHKNDRAQPFAARAAVSLVEHVFSKPDVLRHLRVQSASPPGERKAKST